ncbi:hypothetical protein Asulf_00198 [Archaeoglobus sulfaticallidus PM70-1]|uniref:OB domain-containing protein n=1 Tax=Archaeoglobus sulfaticallidus PM70-1 TaxID=387631 RepID=N0BDA6_9EURY|nr:OB-fold nucleic acid binding domain-containing protein [Archaeoglobus sulfaticallidus]AGK60232.1 hypothetical protein Asulf_00198 [Archaeoglobus sulfaticallidus PM70-1]
MKQGMKLKEYYKPISEEVEFEDFLKRYDEIKEHFGDYITEETALQLTVYSFGHQPIQKISDVVNGSNRVVRVSGVVEEIEYFYTKGMVAKLKLKDESGVVGVKFWKDCAELVKVGDVFEGCIIEIKGFLKQNEIFVSSAENVEIKGFEEMEGIFLGKERANEKCRIALAKDDAVKIVVLDIDPDVNFGDRIIIRQDSVERVGKGDPLPFFNRIADLGQRVNLIGRVSGIGIKRGNYADMYLSDDSGRIRVVLWDSKVEIFKEIDIGDHIVILRGYVKNGEKSEVHCGWESLIYIVEKFH